jgi:heme exporter protein B
MSIWRATWIVFEKDLRLELRTGEILVTTTFFSLLVAVITSLSFYLDDVTARKIAPGVLWISVAFSGILAMGRSWSREREQDVVRGMLLSPLPREGIFLGKSLGVLSFLLMMELLLAPLVSILYSFEFSLAFGPVLALLVLGSVGFAAAGTLFASMGVRSRAKDMLLSVVLFPLISPALLCGVVATREVLGGASLAEVMDWVRILVAFDLVFVVLGAILFGPLLSD